MAQGLAVTVYLDNAEANALTQLAERECRHPREHLRYLFRQEAERRKLLSSEKKERKLEHAES